LERCFFCHGRFAPNETVERFPVARRVAFDPARGRLWAVCASCRRWSLAPMEERWEALEELERLARDRGRVRASTGKVSLLRVGDTELVRVGRDVGLREESHWRYTREFAARRRRAEAVERAGEVLDATVTLVVAAAAAVIGGMPLFPDMDPDKWARWARLRRFGRRAWAGQATCGACGQALPAAPFEERGSLMLECADDGSPRLRRLCPACGLARDSGAVLDAVSGQHTLRRALAYENFAGATSLTIGDAVAHLENAGGPVAFHEQMAARHVRLGRIPLRLTLGLEIAVAEQAERELLDMEAAALELRWREEETLAAIVDGELTPLSRQQG
jgi:hypothetical protein